MKLHLPLLLLSAVMSVAMLPAAAETSDETLIVNEGETVILENKHSLDVEVQKDATLQFSGNDMFSYDEGRVGQKFKVSGGTVDFGTTRQTFTKYTMCLSDGATLMGVGQTGDGTGGTSLGVEYGAIDVIDSNMLIEATSGSNTISAWTRLRRPTKSGDPYYGVEYKVADTAVLTVSGKFIGEGNITKSGAGTMYLSSSEASLRSITVSEGSLEIQSGTYTVSGGISGTSIAMGTTGEVALTLTGETVSVSALLTGKAEVVIAGGVTYNQANTYTGTTTVNQGKTLYLNLGADAQGNDQVYEVKGSMMGAGALQIAQGTNAVIKDTAVALDVVTTVYGALTFDLEGGKEYKLSNDLLKTLLNRGDTSHLYKTGAGTLTFTKESSCGSYVHVDEGVLKLDLGTNSAGENQVFNARNSYEGNGILQVESGTTFNVAAGAYIEPDIRMNGGHAVFVISGEYELRGSLSGNGEIKKQETGTLVFKDAVDYSGTLELEAGSLKFDRGAAEDGSNREISFAGGLSGSGTLMVQEGTTLTLTEKDAYTRFSYELNGGALKFVGIKEGISSLNMSNTGIIILGEGSSFTAGSATYWHDFVLDGGNAEFGSYMVGKTTTPTLSGSVTVNEGSTLTFTGTDALDYGDTRTLTVNAGGTVNFDGGSGTDKGTRQTMDGWTIVLNGGKLVGSGQVINEVNYGSIDYADYENASSTKKPLTYHMICAESGESTLSAGIRLRGMNVGVEFKVDEDATLTVDKAIMLIAGQSGDKSSAGIVKTGKGELIFETDHAFSGTTEVQAGTLSLDTKGVYDLDGNVTGDGTLSVKSGTELQLGNYSVSTATTKLEQGASITSGSEMKISGGTMNHVTVANGSVTGAADEWARLAGVRIELLNDAALVLSDVGLLFGTEVVGSSVASGVTPLAESALNKVELLRTTLEIRLPETGKVVNPVDDILPDDFAIVLDDATDATGYAFSSSAFQGVELSGELVLSFSMDNVRSILDSGYDYLVITFSESVLTDLEVFAWFEPADTLISATVSGNSVYISTPAVPESSTATLSLLALLGLCARRRRK